MTDQSKDSAAPGFQGPAVNPYAPPSTPVEARPEPKAISTDGPVGLAGWLVIVCIGLIATPLRLSYFLLQTYPPIFRDGTWDALTTPGTESYHPFWAPLLLGEITVNLAMIAMSIYLLYLFFRHSARFPKLYILLLGGSLFFILIDAFAAQVVLPNQPLMDAETGGEFGRSAIVAAIWIPYMLKSRRVRNTFVRDDF